MPKGDKYRPLNIRSIQDERILQYNISPDEITLPSVGIFDEPTRCYKINHQWAKIVTGAISLLIEIAAWDEAENEGYNAILEIQKFLIGEDCMDCNDVEDCLTTSPIIIAIQDAIDALEANDAMQDADIDALEANDAIQDAAISDHEGRLSQAELSIQQHNLDISDLQSRVNSAEISIQQHDLTLTDHETRITDLESAGGGNGGGGGMTVIPWGYHNELSANVTANVSEGWVEVTSFPHNFTYTHVMMILEMKVFAFGGTGRIRLRVTDGTTNLAFSTNEAWAYEQNHMSIQLVDVIDLPQTGNLIVHVDITNTTGANMLAKKGQQIPLAIWEYSSQQPIINTVTFDSDSAPYTLMQNQVGSVQNAGNPENGLVGGCNAGEFIGISYDNGGDTIQDINLDMYLNDKNVFRLQIHADGTLIYDQPMDFSGQSNIWFNHRVSDFSGSLFPVAANEIEVSIINPSGNITTARMDNIEIEL